MKPVHLLIFLITCIPIALLAQHEGVQRIRGRIIDPSGDPVAGAYIKNMNSSDLAISDTIGLFEIPMRPEDSLIIVALGREVKKFIPQTGNFESIILNMVSFELKSVNIYDLKDWELFKKEFAEVEVPGEKMNTKGLPSYQSKAPPITVRSNQFIREPTALQQVISPFSALSYRFSKVEKDKRKTWKQMQQDASEVVYHSIVNQDSLPKFVEISPDYLSEFILYCNMTIEEKSLDDRFYYLGRIKELWNEFIATKIGRSNSN